MSGREWPADPMDPRCPECDGPVSATASYCMHCEADLPAADFDPRETASGVDADFVSASDTDGAPAGESVAEQVSAAADAAASGGTAATGGSARDDDRLLDPDGLLDDVSTVMVGAVGGLLAGVLLLPLAVWLFPDPLESLVLPVAVVGWLAATAWMVRTRTVFGAVRKAGYALGGLLALVPPLAAVAATQDGPVAALGATVLFGVFVWPVALVVAGVGYVVGRAAGDGDG